MFWESFFTFGFFCQKVPDARRDHAFQGSFLCGPPNGWTERHKKKPHTSGAEDERSASDGTGVQGSRAVTSQCGCHERIHGDVVVQSRVKLAGVSAALVRVLRSCVVEPTNGLEKVDKNSRRIFYMSSPLI